MPNAVSRESGNYSNWHFYWLCLLILSFSYELPIAFLTSFDRTNPRLYDVVVLIGALTVLPMVRLPKPLPLVFRRWMQLVLWFVFCAIVWATAWLPWDEAGKFTLFYAAKYLEGLLAIFLAACIPLTARRKRIILYTMLAGGVFVTLYAIPEYLSGSIVRTITEGTVNYSTTGAVLSSLGSSYFHLATYSPMVCAMALASAGFAKNPAWRMPLFCLALALAFPALVCGSRAGLVAVFLVLGLAFVLLKRIRSAYILLLIAGFVLVATEAVRLPTADDLIRFSRGFERLLLLEERGGADSFSGRTVAGEDTYLGIDLLDRYSWQGLAMPVFGGGFYSVPQTYDGELFYRVGYGIHNIYLFPLEQGGIVALILFGMFCYSCVWELKKALYSTALEDKTLASAAIMFLVALALIGWAGQVFWQGFGTENFNTYILIFLVLATKRTDTVQLASQKSEMRGSGFASEGMPPQAGTLKA